MVSSGVVLIADRFASGDVAGRVAAAVEAGVRWVQLRDHGVDDAAFLAAARALVGRLRAIDPGVRVSVNSRTAVAAALGCGLHLGVHGDAVEAARRVLGSEAAIGFSAHGVGEAARVVAAGVDYFFFSPVFPTNSKPGHPGAGLDALRTFCAAFRTTPVFALGGVTPQRVAACRAAGAAGVAVLSGLLAAPDVREAARAYLTAWNDVGQKPTAKSQQPL